MNTHDLIGLVFIDLTHNRNTTNTTSLCIVESTTPNNIPNPMPSDVAETNNETSEAERPSPAYSSTKTSKTLPRLPTSAKLMNACEKSCVGSKTRARSLPYGQETHRTSSNRR